MSRCMQIQQYKTLVLRVGYDERKHGYLNPCVSVIEGVAGGGGNSSSEPGDSYKPAPFYPTYPYDNDAHICHIMLRPDEAGVSQMMTTENDIIQDETIVEFSYDETQPVNWRWSALRVRHDKTSEYRSGGKNYGNAYHVANNNWHSIHNALTPEMMMTGEGIPDELSNNDVYYNHVDSGSGGGGGGGGGGIDVGRGTKVRTLTKGMRDFHNLYVKRKLIMSVARPGNSLIDLAVGKGGDLPKWIAAKLGFVFGIDYSKDNLEHKFDGVCARYLDLKKTKRNIPDAIFIHGDSSKEIRTGQAAISERYRLITRAIFGEGAKDASLLGRGVYPHYGHGADGFDICSVQFAIHYFFENIVKVHTFLQNVAECTKLGGYFIGTCFDGARIFQALSRLESGSELSILSSPSAASAASSSDPQKMWSVRKKYHQTEFEPDSSSIGYEIEVFQDSINKATREYLVNFDYLTQLLENYGFDLVTPEESETTLTNPMPDGTATFDGMYHQMEIECKKKHEEGGSAGWERRCQQEYGSALYMSAEEKQISFYNRYFIFRKNRNINAKQLKSSFLSYAGLQEEQHRASSTTDVTDEAMEHIALEKIAKASRPIDVASKPAIAARILEEQKDKVVAATMGSAEEAKAISSSATTLKIKPKPKKVTVKAAVAAAEAPVEEDAPSAPIEQLEKKIQKRTKKAKPSDSTAASSVGAEAGAGSGAGVAPVKPKRQTKKKTDL
jgi:mRNA capping enzyme